MSQTIIEKLLKGAEVEWKPLKEIALEITSGGTPDTSNAKYYDGEIPWVRSQEIKFGEIWDTGIKISEEGFNNSSVKWVPINSILIAMYGATVGKVAINKIPVTTNQACANIQIDKKLALYKYIFYVICNNYEFIKNLGKGIQTNINMNIIKKLLVPIPPLSVQKEIVRILDAFTAHTAELTAELNERKKQYNYYRDKLLTFSDDEVEWKPIDEIAEIYGGLIGKTKSDFEKGNAIYIPYKNIYDNISVDFNNVNLVNVSLDESQNRVEYGDILFTGSSETIEETGLSSVVTQKNRDPVYLNSFSFGVRINNKSLLIPDFSKYLFRSKFMRKEIIRCANGVTRFNLSKAHFKKIKIPIPPLSVQKEIVRKLDAFSMLTTSISAGLPREIELRNKHYEYYRDQLLNFPKPENDAIKHNSMNR
ncbi:Type I restriction modification DNA specificity domain [Bartonella apis]|uniref:restriction endonuclease subunit S n=1 Tax=Bartonella apis TaxID=1686310 RepID=UPI003997A49D